MEQSYLNVKWMKEAELEEYSYKSKQKIRRYQMQKDKKKALVSYYLNTGLSLSRTILVLTTGDESWPVRSES